MKFQLALALFVTTFAGLLLYTAGEGDGEKEDKKCPRAIPLLPWKSSYRTTCRYLCRGWPLRYEKEPDGVHCGAIALFVKTHVCSDGKCVRAESVQSTTTDGKYFTTIPSTSTSAPAETEGPFTTEKNTETEAPFTTVKNTETEAPFTTEKTTVISFN